MKTKKCGYFWRCRRTLLKFASPLYGDAKNHYIRVDSFYNIPPKRRKWIITHWFDFRGFFLIFILACSAFAFQGVGDCEKLLSDFAQLTQKSVFVPHALSGHCVVQNEKHFPLILKSAGFEYKLKDDFLQVSAIEKKVQTSAKKFLPKPLLFDVSFVFVNTSSVLDCGLTMGDVIASLDNLDYSFSFGLALGCPALDFDGSFAFRVNAKLLDSWNYSHGNESQRQNAQITSSTGAVTNQYEYVTTGLNLALEQNEKGVFYSLKYTGNNGSVTTSRGGIVDEVRATIMDEYTRIRKFAFIPIGKEKKLAMYTLVLRIVPKT